MTTSLITAFLVGLLGGVHCVGMCGGIVATLSMGLSARERSNVLARLPLQLGYNMGRIAGYTLAGALVGGLGGLLVESEWLQWTQRLLYLLAALIMIAAGLYLGGWWRGLVRVERLGANLWRLLEPIGRRALPVTTWRRAFLVGLVWAWLPCGLVYSVLILAMSSGGILSGAALMAAFGLGTMPNLLGMGMLAGAAARYTESALLRRLAGALVVGFGLYALWQLFVV